MAPQMKRASSAMMVGATTATCTEGIAGTRPNKKGVPYTAFPANFESIQARAVATGMELTIYTVQLVLAILTADSKKMAVWAGVVISLWHGTLWLLGMLVLKS